MTTMALPERSLRRLVLVCLQLVGFLCGLTAVAAAQQQSCSPVFAYHVGDSSASPLSVPCTLTASTTPLTVHPDAVRQLDCGLPKHWDCSGERDGHHFRVCEHERACA
jgi:hypothetical protein